ncbi:Por secretion system C-terminal sorting domain-containing protein [Algoriphagus locisalis]|uniref:Por secretion system C-terminal sorting domain-containing protein n=1 Tax=Algoriphagus locisalis TaxID=305507 RepID=A0A1I7BAY8_9BACT|nr:T9SS type A sorting domain-containing protein [Algoriphagus locisalis]SFT84271.1 Por secretion system C-terminal sorting domain-containing protein [Algoriphagus locisalis]
MELRVKNKAHFLCFFVTFVSSFCAVQLAYGNKVYADVASGIVPYKFTPCGGFLQPNCDPSILNLANAAGDPDEFAELIASPGTLVGLGAYRSKIELRFDSSLPANTTTYIRIGTEESLLESLLGGSLGDLVSTVLGAVLLGEQEIIVEARNESASIELRSSLDGFDSGRVRLVMDSSGAYFIAITPASAYDRIHITNQSNSIAGLGKEYSLEVYHAFYFEQNPCGYSAEFTSFDGAGLTLDALSLNAQIDGLNLAIDEELENTYSEISLGVVGLAGSMEQMIYFNNPVQPGNEVLVSMGTGKSLLDLGLLDYVELVIYSSGVEIETISASSLLDLDLLGLLGEDEFFKLPLTSDLPIDKIGIRMSSLVGLGVLEGSLKISGVTVSPVRPAVVNVPEEGSFVICQGNTVTVTPINEAGGDLNWYILDSGTEQMLGTASSYTTASDLEPGEYEFLVRSTVGLCATESEPANFKVKVNPIPDPANIQILPSGYVEVDENGKYIYVEGENPVTLEPSHIDMEQQGEFKWYLDETMMVEIQDGDKISDITYDLDGAIITMTGLKFRDELDPYKFYLNYVPEEGCAMEVPMEIDLSAIARILHISLLEFSGRESNKRTFELNWKFAGLTEQDIVKVERSGPSLRFEELVNFTDMDGIEASFYDTHPHPGNNYYRLQIVDAEGRIKFSSQLLRFELTSLGVKTFGVFPNTFENHIDIRKESQDDLKANIALYSGDGSALKLVDFEFTDLKSDFRITDLDGLPAGNYVLRVYFNGKNETHHLIKQ